MTEKLESNGGGAEKRRSTRIQHSASITVRGTDTLGQPFRETTKTVMVNCYGCQYQGIRYPSPNSSIMLEVRHRDPRRLPRVVPARVIWVRRPQAYRSLYHVGIEFEVPGNVWDIALPPEDWFPSPEDQELVIPVSGEENLANPNQFVLRASLTDLDTAGSGPKAPANAQITSKRAIETLFLPEERLVIARADSAENSVDSSASIAEMVRMLTAEAVAKEIVRIREFIDAELQGAVDRAVDRLSDRITASSELRKAVLESPMSPGNLSEASDQMTDQSELPNEPPSTQDAQDPVQPSARQRRAAKRARRVQKTTP